jgi:branched-chain amino acid transport system ATP-binding protein
MAAALLELQSASVRFGGVTALNDVTLRIDEGEAVGLVGPNGAGKSTLVAVVSGAQRCRPGSVHFAGVDVTRRSPHVISGLGLARTFQIVHPFTGLTAHECVTLSALFGSAGERSASVRAARDRASETLEFVGLSTLADMPAESLNAAQRRMLEIGRAVAARPRLILLDEVLSGLNTAEIEHGLGLIRSIRQRGIAVVMIEHIVQAVVGIAERIVVLDQGAKIADGPAAAVLRDEHAIRAYFGAKAPA